MQTVYLLTLPMGKQVPQHRGKKGTWREKNPSEPPTPPSNFPLARVARAGCTGCTFPQAWPPGPLPNRALQGAG